MKKLIIAVFAMLSISAASFAQKKKAATEPTPIPKTAAPTKPKKATEVTTESNAPLTDRGPLKKDGTPDKRYKANKTAPKPKLKKDGTPDKRYKENK